MRTIITILVLAAITAGCAQQAGPVDSYQARRDRYLSDLHQIYGDDSDFKLARAIEMRLQRIELDKKLGR